MPLERYKYKIDKSDDFFNLADYVKYLYPRRKPLTAVFCLSGLYRSWISAQMLMMNKAVQLGDMNLKPHRIDRFEKIITGASWFNTNNMKTLYETPDEYELYLTCCDREYELEPIKNYFETISSRRVSFLAVLGMTNNYPSYRDFLRLANLAPTRE